MLARIRKAQENNEGGFTLIELLVVMIIIGILAAIAIPVFLSQRAKARDTSVKADVSTLGKEIATYYVDNTGALTVAMNGTNSVDIK
ncbi:MAG: type pilus assembly protein PilA, partial [Frankiales bacterium]|nr:type pilus assembly protein PilA [Frankiales bacterium]